MPLKRFKQLVFLLCFTFAFFSYAQEKQKITIEYAGNASTAQKLKMVHCSSMNL